MHVFRAVVGEGLMLALIGVTLGIAGGLGALRLIAQYVYGVRTTDPVTFIIVASVLVSRRRRGQLRAGPARCWRRSR